MHEKYRKETVPALMKRFGWKNMMAVPKIQKITLNIGLGEASQNAKLLDTAAIELGQITGQKPVITKAKKSIANFKIRKGMPIGCAVTLRGEKMYEFLDRLCNVVLPRVRDFRGLPGNAFDGRGNYTLGLKDQLVFPEIDYTRVDKIKGMNVTLTTTAKNDDRKALRWGVAPSWIMWRNSESSMPTKARPNRPVTASQNCVAAIRDRSIESIAKP